MSTQLPPLYYLSHFHAVLEWLHQRYSDLLSAEESGFICAFNGLSQDSQALAVRMILRRPVMLRWPSLHYQEIGNPQSALASLVKLGWVDNDPAFTIDSLARLARRDELLAAPWASHLPAATRKQDVITLLHNHFGDNPPPRRWQEWLPGNAEQWVAFTRQPVIERFKLLYFGNLYQDWSEFVLTDLGQQRYEQVTIDNSARAFHSRIDIENAEQLHLLGQAIVDGDDLDVVLDCLRSQHGTLPDFLEARRQKRFFQLGAAAEKQRQWTLAEQAYQHTEYPGTAFRHTRVLEQLERPEAAYQRACQGLNSPLPDSEHASLRRALPRLARRAKQSPPTTAPSSPWHEETLQLSAPPTGSIEHAACKALTTTRQSVHYVENNLLCGLFGLLFWDVIFAPLPGAFFHPFQRGPADLYQPDFCERRQELIDRVWASLADARYADLIQQRWQQKYGIANPFVVWPALSETLLQQTLAVIPATHLQLCFARILADRRQHSRGLPDLLALDASTASYRLIEIKGPGDRLQDHQISWFRFFHQHHIPASVCHVRWEGH